MKDKLTPIDIKAIRERYGVPANQMSRICGFGVNQWRGYENGSEPNESNSNLIWLIADPRIFLRLVDNCKWLDTHQKEVFSRKANKIADLVEAEKENMAKEIYYSFS